MRALILALLIAGSASPSFAADLEANKQLYRDMLENVFNKRQPEALDRYVAPGIIEHNPNLPQGLAGRKQFVANVRTLPVYRMLEWGVRQGVVDSVIGDTDELVALTLAYQMLNDLTRTIDFALTNAERGTTSAGAADGASASVCQTRILTKGVEQLRDLRDEVLRQRAQMRQSYVAALGQANLSASYAGLVRQRDRDARDATGAASARNQ